MADKADMADSVVAADMVPLWTVGAASAPCMVAGAEAEGEVLRAVPLPAEEE